MSPYVAVNHVPKYVLEAILSGTYSRELSNQEKSLVAAVPENSRPWFEKVVISDFYLPLREVMKDSIGMLERLIKEFFPEEQIRPQPETQTGDERIVVRRLPLRKRYEYLRKIRSYSRQQSSSAKMTFEELMGKTLSDYKKVLINNINVAAQSNDPFKCIGVNTLIDSIVSRLG